MAEQKVPLVLDENIICNAIEGKNSEHKDDDTCKKLILSIYEKCHNIIVVDKNLENKYKKEIKDRIKRGDSEVVLKITAMLKNNKKYYRYTKHYIPLPENVYDKWAKNNEEDVKIAKLAISAEVDGVKVYGLITDDNPFYEWLKNVLLNQWASENNHEITVLNSKQALNDKKIIPRNDT